MIQISGLVATSYLNGKHKRRAGTECLIKSAELQKKDRQINTMLISFPKDLGIPQKLEKGPPLVQLSKVR